MFDISDQALIIEYRKSSIFFGFFPWKHNNHPAPYLQQPKITLDIAKVSKGAKSPSPLTLPLRNTALGLYGMHNT